MFLRLLEVGGIVYGREIDLIDALLLDARLYWLVLSMTGRRRILDRRRMLMAAD